eukprot:1140592-Pelagomonas_calceolata.AAC.1
MLQGVWNADALAEHNEHTNKLAESPLGCTSLKTFCLFKACPFLSLGAYINVIGVTKEDSKMKSMPCSFALELKQTIETHRSISKDMDIFLWLAQSSGLSSSSFFPPTGDSASLLIHTLSGFSHLFGRQYGKPTG